MEAMKDIEYLEQMKRLEREDISEEERKKSFHIVPISGLIISILCRKENECKTVLEVNFYFIYLFIYFILFIYFFLFIYFILFYFILFI